MENNVITPEIFNHYAERFTSPLADSINELDQETNASIRGAHMLSGHLQGMFLKLMSDWIQPKFVLELGTYTGYSAMCLASGLKEGGKVITIDSDKSLVDIRNKYWQAAGLTDKIEFIEGKGLDVLPDLKQPFDLIFIDADKRNYGPYFDLIIDQIPVGACIIADNVMFHGEVVLSEDEQSKSAKFMHEFNQKISQDDRVEQVLLPIRDGLLMIRKIK